MFAVALGGCAESVVTQLDLLNETASVVFSREGCGEDAPELLALEVDDLRFDFAYCEQQDVALHEYDRSLESLCLAPGRLIPYEGADPLPSPRRAQTGVVANDQVQWTKLEANARSITDAVVPPIDVLACIESDLCIDATDTCVCTQACERPEPLELDEVELPNIECPPGWITTTPRPQLTACRAYDPAVECGEGEVALPGRGCVRLRTPCPVDGWPNVVADVYVRSAAKNGDGSLGMPFGDLATAVSASPPDAVIALAPGRYVLPTMRDQATTFVGACAEEVVLDVTMERQLISSALRFDDVTLALGQTLQLFETTTATLAGVIVEGDGAINARGVLHVRDSEFRSLLRVIGTATVFDSWFGGGVAVRAGALELVRSSVVSDDRTALVSGDASTLRLDQVRVASSSVALQAIQGGSLRVSASEIDGIALLNTDSVEVDTTYFRGGTEFSRVGRCNSEIDQATFRDVVLESTDDEVESLVILCSKTTNFDRVASLGGSGLRVSFANVRFTDVRVFDSTLHGILMQGAPSTASNRVHISDVGRVGFAVDDNWDHTAQYGVHGITGLLVERAIEAAVRFDDTSGAELRDVHIREALGDGIVISPDSVAVSSWAMKGLLIDGVEGSRVCADAINRECAGVGILVDGDFGDASVTLNIEDVEIANAETAVQLLGVFDLHMQRVLLRDSRVGLYALTPAVLPRTYVTNVDYRDNETAIVFGE